MYTEYIYQDSLAHHGILGQKWGKRNGPPYPLGYESHSGGEKRRNSISRIDGISKHNKPKSSDNRLIRENKKSSKNENREKRHLTEKQKKALKVAGAIAGTAAVVGLSAYVYKNNPAVKKALDNSISKIKNKKVSEITSNKTNDYFTYIDSKGRKVITKDPEKQFIIGDKDRKIYTRFCDGEKNPLANKGFSVITKTKTTFDGKTNTFNKQIIIADSKGFNHTKEDFLKDVEVTNIGAKGKVYGRNHNCVSCAINMEMRARGIDSIAKEQPGGKYEFSKIFKTLNLSSKEVRENMYKGDDPKEFIKILQNQPDGSRGIIGSPFKSKVGKNDMHFYNYVKSDGKLYILDGQQENPYIDIKDLFTTSKTKTSKKLYTARGSMIIRTDNRSIDYDSVTDYIEPNLGQHYNISDDMIKRWRKNGLPQTKLVSETMADGRTAYALDKNYRRIKGIYEK